MVTIFGVAEGDSEAAEYGEQQTSTSASNPAEDLESIYISLFLSKFNRKILLKVPPFHFFLRVSPNNKSAENSEHLCRHFVSHGIGFYFFSFLRSCQGKYY